MTDETFETLSRRVFQHQYQNNPQYRNYCVSKEVTPENTDHWTQIPALPTDAFKYPDLPIVSFPIGQKKHTFLTSGTTTDRRGAHLFPSLDLYEASIHSAWRGLNLPEMACAVFLTPTAEEAPQSSLSHMMHVLAPVVADQSVWLHTPDGGLDISKLKKHAAEGRPLYLFGTALAFLQVFDQLTAPLLLPEGSLALETGGYKGSHRQLQKAELYSIFEEKFGLPNNSIINEYSMTELSSQFYTRGIGNTHQGPPWARIRVIDPRTGLQADAGMPGYLVVYDLANLHSVMAIQTQDIAIAHGDRSFTLLGRDPSALPRGCSRAADAHSQR